ncbi:MAG: metallophosphoesterase family protein, partial [Nitrososphaeraceae archaeon]
FDGMIDGLDVGVCHGTSVMLKIASIRSQIYAVFIYGHTHKKEESRIGKTVVLYPGTGHKKIKNTSGAFSDGGTMIFNTRTNKIAYQPLP